MTLEYGEKEVLRFMYDRETKQLNLATKQPIIEDGVIVGHIYPQVIARENDFDTVLERLMPSSKAKLKYDDPKQHLEEEGKALIEEQKLKKIAQAKEPHKGMKNPNQLRRK